MKECPAKFKRFANLKNNLPFQPRDPRNSSVNCLMNPPSFARFVENPPLRGKFQSR